MVKVPGLPGRWPAYWLRARQTVLPAFSAFSGGCLLGMRGDDAAVACIEGHLLSIRGAPEHR